MDEIALIRDTINHYGPVFIASLSIQIRRAGVQKKFGGRAGRLLAFCNSDGLEAREWCTLNHAMKTTRLKPQRMKAYGSFSEWKKDQLIKNQKLIGALQRLVKGTAPHLMMTVKWGQGCWVSGTIPNIFYPYRA